MARAEPIASGPTRRGALAGGLAVALAGNARASAPGLAFSGRFVQSGTVIGRTAPRAKVLVDGTETGAASANGLFVVGFDRDAPDTVDIRLRGADGVAEHLVQIGKGSYDVQAINGLPADQVEPTDPALLARIAREIERKNVGFASRADTDDFRDGFVWPLKSFRLSARFGGQRILNGVPKRPHYGADLAAPIGTPVTAPAAGLVSFAETGLHFEGSLIMIDHGQGLLSMYLHLSRVDVSAGQKVQRGEQIGLVGMEGRATGPHLCWRMSWRGRHLDPTMLVGTSAPTA